MRLDADHLAVGRALPGRGAWLCAGSASCLDEAARKRQFARAFRAPVTDAAVARLQAVLQSASYGRGDPREDGGPDGVP